MAHFSIKDNTILWGAASNAWPSQAQFDHHSRRTSISTQIVS